MRKLLLLSLPALLLTASFAARADAKAESKRYFDAGVSLLKAENYEGAAASFEASLEAYPTKTALFNLANCYKALNRYDEALAALFRLRRDFAGRLGDEMEAETAAIEREIRNLVGTLKIEVDRPGAAVLVDGRKVGVSPLSKALLQAPGSHEVTAELEGVEFPVEKVWMLPGQGAGRAGKREGRCPGPPTPALPREGREPEIGGDEGASLPSPRSLGSLESAPLFWLTDNGAGVGVAGRF